MSSIASEDADDATSRRRGCKCKKSSCLKHYCICFVAGGRCGEHCQCVNCKNQPLNREEIAKASTVQEPTQKSSRPSLPIATEMESEPTRRLLSGSVETQPTLLTDSETALEMAGQLPRSVCTCADGECTSECPCLGLYGGCSSRCGCKGCVPVVVAQTGKSKGCSCKKSNCLKLYCECLASQQMCDDSCICQGCKNVPEYLPERELAVAVILERNPLAFQPKVGGLKGCSCKKSNCLKLYCECLAAQRLCDHRCNCQGCKNGPETMSERDHAVTAIMDRNPLAFKPKLVNGSSQHLRGCNCRKSGCMKNYCECHQAGVVCTLRCACLHCQNTEDLMSAKKMIDLSGFSSDDDSLDIDRASQRRIVRRPTGLQTPTYSSTRRPSALEMLSRSAPVARSQLFQRNSFAMDGSSLSTPTKRPSTHMEHYHTAEQASTFAQRKYLRRASTKLSFGEMMHDAADDVPMLPSVEDTVTNVYDARNTEGVGDAELTILSRSLLLSAMTVELAEESKAAVETSIGPSKTDQQSGNSSIDIQRPGSVSDGREALSPATAGLFCEEEYSDGAGDDVENGNDLVADNHTVNGSDQTTRQDQRHQTNLSIMQERAVLQEFSVRLRNLLGGVSSY